MRPVDKGPIPLDENGNAIGVSDYKKWRSSLIDRIGAYCVYCDMPLSHSLNVEHVQPKNPPAGFTPGDPIAWDNMLLACGPCNNAKDNTPINFDDCYFPENNNTLLPFKVSFIDEYSNAAIIDVADDLLPLQTTKAQRTIDLLDLDNVDNRPDIVDLRWKKRFEVVIRSKETLDYYNKAIENGFYNGLANLVATTAFFSGFFSVWFNVFRDHPEVRKALIEKFKGTATDCFDENFDPISRNPDNVVDPI